MHAPRLAARVRRPVRRARHGSSGISLPGVGDAPARATVQHDLTTLAAVARRVASGDLEARVPALSSDDPVTGEVRAAVNAMIDVMDAYIRESQAVLLAAGSGAFERRFLARGMPGSFREGALRIDEGRERLHRAAIRESERQDQVRELSEQSYEASEMLASAAVELAASTDSLLAFSRGAVERAREVADSVGHFEESSRAIEGTATVITHVAAQTRLLALNATIESARAGEAGRGFGVVAHEVKTLADEVKHAAEAITGQVERTREDSALAIGSIASITAMVEEIVHLVEQIAVAANGVAGQGGLAQMAEHLRGGTARLLHQDESRAV